jgi:MFS family permease
MIGILGALPFLAQVFQLPGAWLTSRLGARRTALVSVALSRQAFLPLALLPWLPVDGAGKRALLVACCAAHHALSILCNNAWVTWFAELVPDGVRGRYVGRRTAICTFGSAAATLAVGLGLDRARAASLSGGALSALALLACGAGAASVALMARQRGGARAAAAPRWSAAAALAPLRDPRATRLLAYLVLWHLAVGFSAPFFGLYLLRDVGAGFGMLALYTAVAALARTATSPAWGRAVDRAGARPVLLACTAGLVASPLWWVSAARAGTWPLLVDAVLGGALYGGQQVATFTLPLAIAPARQRPHYHAAFSAASGCAFAVASACGGALVAAGPRLLGTGGSAVPIHLTFAASLGFRVAAAAASLAVADARTVGAVAPVAPWRALRRAVPRARVAHVHRAARAGLRWMTREGVRAMARAGAAWSR